MASRGPESGASPVAVNDSDPGASVPTTITQSSTTPSLSDIKNGSLAKAGQDLITIYQEFQQQGGKAPFTSSKSGLVKIQGTSVGVDIQSAGGDFNSFVSAMTTLGMQVRATDATDGIVEGFLPISQLPSAAQNSQTLSLSPIYIPISR
jgi:hypothetical protein